MIPSALTMLVMMLAAYRLTRLVGWDDFPLARKTRAWATGETWTDDGAEVELPGKTPDSNVEGIRVAYSRPLLAHLVHCPFCVGFWISLATYLAWLTAPTVTMYGMMPFAISGAVGLVAKNLDP